MTTTMTANGNRLIAESIEAVIKDTIKGALHCDYSALPELEAYLMKRDEESQAKEDAKQRKRKRELEKINYERSRRAADSQHAIRKVLTNTGYETCPCCEMRLSHESFTWTLTRDTSNQIFTHVTLTCPECESPLLAFDSWYDKPVENFTEFQEHLMVDFPLTESRR